MPVSCLIWDASQCELSTYMRCLTMWVVYLYEMPHNVSCLLIWEMPNNVSCLLIWDASQCELSTYMRDALQCELSTYMRCLTMWVVYLYEMPHSVSCLLIWEMPHNVSCLIIWDASQCELATTCHFYSVGNGRNWLKRAFKNQSFLFIFTSIFFWRDSFLIRTCKC